MTFLAFFFNLLEPLFRWGQRVLGIQRLGWLFVAPNLIVFGLFCFLPILINVVYATTGGGQPDALGQALHGHRKLSDFV